MAEPSISFFIYIFFFTLYEVVVDFEKLAMLIIKDEMVGLFVTYLTFDHNLACPVLQEIFLISFLL